MSFCDYHPDRNAIGKCSICGKYVCSECAGHSEDPIICIHCKSTPKDSVWVSSKQPSPSPWDTDTSVHMNKRTHNYFVVGMFGALLWILVNTIYAYTNVSLWFFQSDTPFLYIVPWTVAVIVGLFYPLLFGVGFLGLSVKYTEKHARYVFYAYVATPLMMVIPGWLMGPYISYSPSTPVSFIPGLLYGFIFIIYGFIFIITIVLGVYSLWRLRSKSNHSTLLVSSAIVWCLYIPLPYPLEFLVGPPTYELAFYGLQSLLAILMVALFYLESRVEREGAKAVRTW